MVSFMRGRCSLDQTTGCFGGFKTDSQKGAFVQTTSDNYSSFTSHCSSLASPRIVQQKSVTFDNMMTFVQGISTWELNGWSTQKIWQFIQYLVDRLKNAKAYKGYFSSFLQVLDVLNNYLAEQKRRGQGLVRGKKRHDLVIALMCVQALNKAYGRRGDIKASCYILAKKVAEDFESVSTLLTKAIYNIDSTLKLRRTDFIVPRDSRRVLASLLDICSGPSNDKSVEILQALEKYGVRAADFTEGDIEWLENELAGLEHDESMFQMYVMLEWLVYLLRQEKPFM